MLTGQLFTVFSNFPGYSPVLLLKQHLYQPADKCGDDDTPGRAAAVGVGLLLVFVPSAAQKNGVEEQEEKVQGQTGERHTSQ